jgi:hypothetical protein
MRRNQNPDVGHEVRRKPREGGQLLDQAALLGLEARPRVVRD